MRRCRRLRARQPILSPRPFIMAPEENNASSAASLSATETGPVAGPANGSPVATDAAQSEESAVILVPGVEPPPDTGLPTLPARIKTILVGKPRDLADHSIFTAVSLVAFLAWVGLGADGLVVVLLRPARSVRHLGEQWRAHHYLAVFLALATMLTVFVISACYSHIIEEFPSGGGGYLVASKLLGPEVGVVSGCALLVDYVLTITTSIAAAATRCSACSMPHSSSGTSRTISASWRSKRCAIVAADRAQPARHQRIGDVPAADLHDLSGHACHPDRRRDRAAHRQRRRRGAEIVARSASNDPRSDVGILAHVGSCSCTPIRWAPARIPASKPFPTACRSCASRASPPAKRTMLYMAFSLAITAGGLMVAYLLLGITASAEEAGKTMNTVLSELFVDESAWAGWLGEAFVLVTIISEGLLAVRGRAGRLYRWAARAGQHGPRLVDAALVRATFRAAGHAQRHAADGRCRRWRRLGLRGGNIDHAGDHVFDQRVLTFSLSMIGMCRHWWQLRHENPLWRRRLGAVLVRRR